MTEINFAELKYPEKFSDFMNQLLNLKFGARAVRPPYDRGRDSYIIDDDGKITIYQYKYFLTAMKPNQRRDLEESLKTALKNYPDPVEWMPCFPRDFTSGEENFLKELSKKYEINISWIGETEIKNWVYETNFPLDQYFNSHMHKKTDRKINEICNKLRETKQIRFETINKAVHDIIEMEEISEEEAEIELPTDIEKKIEKNKFSGTFGDILRMQMTRFSQIDSYLRSGALRRKDINGLIFSLKMVYLKFRNRYDNGDDIFEEMIDYIIPSNINDEEYQAYCTLVCYFFHTCEVFENVDST
ncbi:MAG: ABC-three component system protein [Candidatus Methanofastidiosia archaeon]